MKKSFGLLLFVCMLQSIGWGQELNHLFKAGDEKAAAMRMLKHINENLSHESAPKWAKDFVTMLEVKESPESEP